MDLSVREVLARITTGLCCTDRLVDVLSPPHAFVQVVRMDFGRPNSSMRFKA
jgi:hypothetical protein